MFVSSACKNPAPVEGSKDVAGNLQNEAGVTLGDRGDVKEKSANARQP